MSKGVKQNIKKIHKVITLYSLIRLTKKKNGNNKTTEERIKRIRIDST